MDLTKEVKVLSVKKLKKTVDYRKASRVPVLTE